MSWIKEHKKICIFIGVLVVILIVAGISAFKNKKSEKEVEQETTTVERRTLMKSISATGKFVAAEEERVTSETMGTEVLAVNVEVGDTVAQGDVICVLDAEDLKNNLTSAKERLQTTKEQESRSKETAKRNLERAKTDRDNDIRRVDEDIADAKQDWDNAEKDYNESVAAYEDANDDLKNIADKTSNAYINAKAQVTAAKRQKEADRRTADAYKERYEQMVSRRDEDIQRVNDNYKSQEDAYQEQIDSSDSMSDEQQERIDQLNEQIAGAVVRAPRGGLVTSVNVSTGSRYNGGVIAVIDNVESFDVTTEIGEFDINHVEAGQKVIIKTNATGEDELEGVVKKVSPIATGQGGSDIANEFGLDIESMMGQSGMSGFSSKSDDVTFTVTISVNTPCDKLRIGMTAKLNIVLQENEDVLSLPYNAVQTDDDETFFVRKVTGKDEKGNYKTKKVKVVKGIESDYYTEIIDSGLKKGDVILLPPAEKGTSLEDMINGSSSMGGL